MCDLGEFLKIKYGKSGICDGFTENQLGVGLKCSLQFFLGTIGRNEGKIDSHLSHGYIKEIEGTAVY